MRRLFFVAYAEPARSDPELARKKGARRRLSRQLFYYDLLELVANTDNSCDLVSRRRRRQTVDLRRSRAVERVRARCVLIDTIGIQVGTLRQEVVHTQDTLMDLFVGDAISLRVVVRCAEQQRRGQLILEVDFGVVELGVAARRRARRLAGHRGLAEILELRVAVRCADSCRAERVSTARG